MRRFLLAPSLVCLLIGQARATPAILAMQSPGEQCRAAIAAAERGHAIPPQLMAAIGRVESGKVDPGTGMRGAWPWTINAEGQGYYFNTKAEAIQAVEGLHARGVRSIDVGCMQVNLMHHPTAFQNLDMAFEPAVNADYAARFLVQLHTQAGDWTQATANYHSSNPAEGGPYAAKVTSVWPEEQRKAGLAPVAPAGSGIPFARAIPGRSPPGVAAGVLGRVPAGVLAPAGMAGSHIAPPGMMQGGTIPAGTLPPGALAAGLARDAVASGTASGAPSGRGLDFYRAAPVRMVMTPTRLALRMGNKFTTR